VLEEAAQVLQGKFGRYVVATVISDVTDETAVQKAADVTNNKKS